MKTSLFICLLFMVNSGFNGAKQTSTNIIRPIKIEETIIVFTQPADVHFRVTTLPKLRALGQAKGIKIIEQKVEKGVPEAITVTPAIVYQNHLGRSIYAARYATFSTIENFIRTSRFIPQQATINEKKEVLVWKNGRAQIIAPIKITPLKGKSAKNFDKEGLKEQLVNGITDNFENFQIAETVSLTRTDRAFYMDFHPYIKEDQCYLTIELYSQFNCIEPIYSNKNQPISGPVTAISSLMTQAKQQLEKAVRKQIAEAKNGDAFTPIPASVPVKEWSALGIQLPKKNNQQNIRYDKNYPLPNDWVFDQAIDDDIPLVQFRFMAPLDRYVGEVKELSGQLSLNEDQVLSKGYFEVNTQSLTMGVPDFDIKIHKAYIKAFKFPKAYFRFVPSTKLPRLALGQSTMAEVEGFFKMMKKEIPLTVSAQLMPVLDQKEQPILKVHTTFSINITDTFGIKGPDGPDPAKKTVEITMNFLMKKGR